MMTAWELTDVQARSGALARPAKPQLHSLAGGKRVWVRVPFAGVVVAILVAGMVGLLALNVHLESQSFELRDLRSKAAALNLEVADKQAQVYAKSGPAELAAAASALGMVPNTYPAFIDLRTGTIVGKPTPVTGNEMPGLRVPAARTSTAVTGTVQSNVQPWFDLGAPAPSATKPTAGAKPAATKPTATKPTATKAATVKASTTKPVTKTTTAKPAKP